MSFSEKDLLPISALQHLLFCERQCALIHVEQIWAENRLTAEGRVLHERAHDPGKETRGRIRAVRGLHIQSLNIGLSGIADVVEFHAPEGRRATELSRDDFWSAPESLSGWRIFPIEYKRGRRKRECYDEVQLCAQALCLEEMLQIEIRDGALFYGEEQGRIDVIFDSELRERTLQASRRLRTVLFSELLPPAIFLPHCSQCSLIEQCMPAVTEGQTSARSYLLDAIQTNERAVGPFED